MSDYIRDRLREAASSELVAAAELGHEVVGEGERDGSVYLSCRSCAATSEIHVFFGGSPMPRPRITTKVELSVNECALERLHESARAQ